MRRARRSTLGGFARKGYAAALALMLSSPAVAAAPPSQGQAAEEQAREIARDFGQRGYERFQQGDHEAAITLFRKAEEHFHAPTHWLYIARSEERLGRLLAAERSYKRVLEDQLAPDAPRPFLDAQASAREEFAALQGRIPTLRVEVTGAPEGVTPAITLDGVPVDAGPRGSTVQVDPGRHIVRVTAVGMIPVEQELDMDEGESRSVPIALEPVPRSGSLVPAGVAFGLGAVGIGVGAITGALSLGKVGELSERCPDKRCALADEPIADQARALGTASTVAFVAGGAFAAAGAVLLVLRPSIGPPARSASGVPLQVVAGPGAVVVRARF